MALAHKKLLFKKVVSFVEKKDILHSILINVFTGVISYYNNKVLIKYWQCKHFVYTMEKYSEDTESQQT